MLLALIRELADYERLQHEVEANAASLGKHLFGESPRCSALVASEADSIVGYALYFPSYSTFRSSRALFLEDLYVTPEARGKGHGRALLAAVAVAARDLGAARLDWNVLAWNQPPGATYRSSTAAGASPSTRVRHSASAGSSSAT